ncbi:hypothetical protein ACFZCV_15730 [Streptomyces sp. NPDC007920]
MHPVHRPALVHPAFENAAAPSDTTDRPATDAVFLADGVRTDTRYLA